MTKRTIICLVLVAAMAICPLMQAYALKDTTLALGSEGEEVRQLQQALIDLNYLDGKADGVYGAKTEDAVRHFQSIYGLTVYGLAGEKTQSKLYSVANKKNTQKATTTTTTTTATTTTTPTVATVDLTHASTNGVFKGNYETLRSGSTGERVKILESCLIALNCMKGVAGTTYDKDTAAGVRTFQSRYSLGADGIAGRKTLVALENLVNNFYEPIHFVSIKGGTASKPEIANGEYLCRGDRGDQVTLIQQRLVELGYKIKVTGKFDEATRSAVITFQERNNLLVDGVVGVKTLGKMYGKNPVLGDDL